MLEHAGEVSIRYRFEIKIAERSKTALKLWKSSSLAKTKVGVSSTEQKNSPFKTYWTDQG